MILARPWFWAAVAFAVRLADFAEQAVASPVFFQLLLDEREALDAARALLDTGSFGTEPFFKAPGYTGLLAAVVLFFGEGGWPYAIRLLQHAMGAAMAAMAADAAARLTPGGRHGRARTAAAAAAGFAVACHGPLVRLETCVGLDLTAMFLQSAMAWSLARFALTWRTGGPERRAGGAGRGWLAAAGLFAAAAWLTRPTLTLAMPALALWVAWTAAAATAGSGWRRGTRAAALFMAPAALAAALVAGRNGLVAGEALVMPWQGGYSLYEANRPGANGRYLVQRESAAALSGFGGAGDSANPTRALALAGYLRPTGIETAPAAGVKFRFGDVDRWWFARAKSAITDDPAAWTSLMARKVLYLASHKEVFNYEEFELHRAMSGVLGLLAPSGFGWLLPAAAAGGVLGLAGGSGRRRRAVAVFVVYAAALAPAIALYYASGRMRMPLMFPAAVLAGVAAGAMAGGFRAGIKRHPAVIASAAVAAILGATAAWGDWYGVRSERMDHADLARLSNAAWRDGVRGRPGRLVMALDLANRAEAARPGYPPVPQRRGQALFEMGRYPAAAAAFDLAAAREPDDPTGPFNLGVTLRLGLKREADARRWFEEALRRRPGHPGATAALAEGENAKP